MGPVPGWPPARASVPGIAGTGRAEVANFSFRTGSKLVAQRSDCGSGPPWENAPNRGCELLHVPGRFAFFRAGESPTLSIRAEVAKNGDRDECEPCRGRAGRAGRCPLSSRISQDLA